MPFVVGEDVPSDMIENLDQGPPHKGNSCEPDVTASCLRTRLYQVKDDEVKPHLVRFANRVCLHCCSSYCLRKTSKGSGDDRHTTFSCRMHFGEENTHPGIKARTDGKPARKDPGFEHYGRVNYLEAPRDHPRFQEGNVELAAAWGANMDIQVVVSCDEDLPEVSAGIDILTFIASFDDAQAAAERLTGVPRWGSTVKWRQRRRLGLLLSPSHLRMYSTNPRRLASCLKPYSTGRPVTLPRRHLRWRPTASRPV
jgi:hypothetical protein